MRNTTKRTHTVRDFLLTLGANLFVKPRDCLLFGLFNMAAALVTCSEYFPLWARYTALAVLCLGTLVLICVAPVLGPATHEGVDFDKYYRKAHKPNQK